MDVRVLVDYLVYGEQSGDAKVTSRLDGTVEIGEIIAEKPLSNAEQIYDIIYKRAERFIQEYNSSLISDIHAKCEYEREQDELLKHKNELQTLINKI